MAHDPFPTPDVSAYLTRVSKIETSTRQRIANSAVSSAEGSVFALKAAEALRASRHGLATRSAPFTVDTFGPLSQLPTIVTGYPDAG